IPISPNSPWPASTSPSSTSAPGETRSSCFMKTRRWFGALSCRAWGGGVEAGAIFAPSPPECQPNQTPRSSQTPGLEDLSHLEPHLEWCLNECHRRRAVWHLARLLQTRAPLRCSGIPSVYSPDHAGVWLQG